MIWTKEHDKAHDWYHSKFKPNKEGNWSEYYPNSLVQCEMDNAVLEMYRNRTKITENIDCYKLMWSVVKKQASENKHLYNHVSNNVKPIPIPWR